MTERLQNNNPGVPFSIGIVAPYQLPSKNVKLCPFDQTTLVVRDVQLWRNKKAAYSAFPMRVCAQCGRLYYFPTQIQPLIAGDYLIKKEEFPRDIMMELLKLPISNVKQNSKKKSKVISDKPTQYVYVYGENKRALPINEKCKWAGCNDKVFRNGLCWEHFQHEMGEN